MPDPPISHFHPCRKQIRVQGVQVMSLNSRSLTALSLLLKLEKVKIGTQTTEWN
jgi:hypothetical protein